MNLKLTGNKLRRLKGDGVAPEKSNVFVAIEDAAEAVGLTSSNNVYCASPTANDAHFLYGNSGTLTFDAWKTTSSTDSTSSTFGIDAPACTSW